MSPYVCVLRDNIKYEYKSIQNVLRRKNSINSYTLNL